MRGRRAPGTRRRLRLALDSGLGLALRLAPGLALGLALSGVPLAAAIADASPPAPAVAAEPPGATLDRTLIALRAAIALATLAILVIPAAAAGRGASPRTRTRRRIALGALALLAFAVNYNLFAWRRIHGIHAHDVYHYYLGAKYFPELGYYGLYACSLQALESGPHAVDDAASVRDLASGRLRRAGALRPTGARCDGAFTPERWQHFRADVRFFRARLGETKWRAVLVDQGYNPSPAWTLVGRPLAELVPANAGSLRLLVRVDLVLMAGAFAAVGWAFGFEALCLAVIAWGANPLSRYQWVGDAFLRHAWLAASIAGLALLRRERFGRAGAFLALAASLRIFPALFGAAYAARELRGLLARRRLSAGFVRFAVTGLATAAVVAGAAAIVSGRGFDAHREFASNIGRYAELSGWNSVGLRPLLAYSRELPEPVVVGERRMITQPAITRHKAETFAARQPFYWGAVLLTLALFWRALRGTAPWESAALGFVLIPVVTQPASYYLSSAVAVAMLATARPRVAIPLLLALVAWCAALLGFYREGVGFVVASAIAIALAWAVLIEYQRPPPADSVDAA